MKIYTVDLFSNNFSLHKGRTSTLALQYLTYAKEV